MSSNVPAAVALSGVVLLAMLSGCLLDPFEEDSDGSEPTSSPSGTPYDGGARENGTGGGGSRDDDNGTTGNGTGGPGGDGNETSGNNTGNASGSPPTAELAAEMENNTTPANVTFRMTGGDPDGDVLNWTLDWDGNGTVDENGTGLPAEVTVLYENPGNYTATLTVTDKDGSVNATANVTLVAPDPSAGVCHRPDAIAIGPYYYDDRPAPGSPNGMLNGNGTWIYRESNDIEGLQVGGPDEEEVYQACRNPDTLIF